MKNIRFYEAEKYNSPRYEKVEEMIYNSVDMYDPAEKKMIYVTSIVYEPEPELDENKPSDSFVSQYPLEDILDEFFVYCEDLYEKENANDKNNSYVEFASEDINDIRKLLSIIGKHVYDQEDGEYVELIIE